MVFTYANFLNKIVGFDERFEFASSYYEFDDDCDLLFYGTCPHKKYNETNGDYLLAKKFFSSNISEDYYNTTKNFINYDDSLDSYDEIKSVGYTHNNFCISLSSGLTSNARQTFNFDLKKKDFFDCSSIKNSSGFFCKKKHFDYAKMKKAFYYYGQYYKLDSLTSMTTSYEEYYKMIHPSWDYVDSSEEIIEEMISKGYILFDRRKKFNLYESKIESKTAENGKSYDFPSGSYSSIYNSNNVLREDAYILEKSSLLEYYLFSSSDHNKKIDDFINDFSFLDEEFTPFYDYGSSNLFLSHIRNLKTGDLSNPSIYPVCNKFNYFDKYAMDCYIDFKSADLFFIRVRKIIHRHKIFKDNAKLDIKYIDGFYDKKYIKEDEFEEIIEDNLLDFMKEYFDLIKSGDYSLGLVNGCNSYVLTNDDKPSNFDMFNFYVNINNSAYNQNYYPKISNCENLSHSKKVDYFNFLLLSPSELYDKLINSGFCFTNLDDAKNYYTKFCYELLEDIKNVSFDDEFIDLHNNSFVDIIPFAFKFNYHKKLFQNYEFGSLFSIEGDFKSKKEFENLQELRKFAKEEDI